MDWALNSSNATLTMTYTGQAGADNLSYVNDGNNPLDLRQDVLFLALEMSLMI